MRKTWPLPLLALLVPTLSIAQQMEMAAVEKWSKVKKVRYQVEARFEGWTPVSAKAAAAQGKATDSYTLTFDWDARAKKILGKAAFTNGKSAVSALRDAQECTTPVLKGEYEHFEIASVTNGDNGLIELAGLRSYPIVYAAVQCPASKALSATPAAQTPVKELVAPPDPQVMSMAFMGVPTGNPNMSFSADKKSFILKVKDWTLTFTPIPL